MTAFYRTVFHLLALSATIFLAVDLFYTAVEGRLWTGYRGNVRTAFQAESDALQRPKLGEYRVIMERNVFGASEQTKEEKEEAPEVLEPTSLDVALLGTVVGDAESPVAVIRDSVKRTEAFYRVGDDVQGALVKKIERGKVILRAGERDEVLTMQDAHKRQATSEVPSPQEGRPSSSPEPVPRDNRTTVSIEREEIAQNLDSVNKLFTQARIRPYFVDGKPGGLAITHVKGGSVFSKMGLRNGDVIKGMDGRDIHAPNDALALFRKLRSGDPFSLELSRRGAPTVIQYRFE